MKIKYLLLGIGLLIIFVVSTVFLIYEMPARAVPYPPTFDVRWTGDTSIQFKLVDMGGMKSVKGLQIREPQVASPTIVDMDTDLKLNQTYEISDPNLTRDMPLTVETLGDGVRIMFVDHQVILDNRSDYR